MAFQMDSKEHLSLDLLTSKVGKGYLMSWQTRMLEVTAVDVFVLSRDA